MSDYDIKFFVINIINYKLYINYYFLFWSIYNQEIKLRKFGNISMHYSFCNCSIIFKYYVFIF